ncbi:hypothetical protein TNMX_03170 [Thermus sp. NMX2.A1]|nr:hypothetical protein TNMX_03170 [Thermus sp. NMX2.A1]
MLLEVAFAGLSPWVFWAGVGLMVSGFVLGGASWLALVLLYPWWRLRQGWRLRLFPGHLSLHPPWVSAAGFPWRGCGRWRWPTGQQGPFPGEDGLWSSTWRTGREYPFPYPIPRPWRPGSENF